MKLPPLRALPVFEAVARLNSFSAAARELNVSQSAISHQVQGLERYLGEALFLRQGRRLALTGQGRAYRDHISSALQQIERASEDLLGREAARLRLAVLSSFAVRWLIPRLPSLQSQYPDLDVALEMTGEAPELSDRVADCFITISRSSRAFTYDLLYEERLFPICSPAYWERMADALGLDREARRNPDLVLTTGQIARFPLLSTTNIYGRPAGDWEAWFRDGGDALPDSARIQHFSHMLMALEAARFDQGIALTNDYMFHQQTDRESFVRLPSHALITGDRFYIAHKTSRRNESTIRRLRHWLIQEAVATGLRR